MHGEVSGGGALRSLYGHDVDLLVTDIPMPGTSGIELLERIHGKISPTLATIPVTGSETMDLAAATLRAGACDLVTKRFTVPGLSFLDGSAEFCPAAGVSDAFPDRGLRRSIPILRYH